MRYVVILFLLAGTALAVPTGRYVETSDRDLGRPMQPKGTPKGSLLTEHQGVLMVAGDGDLEPSGRERSTQDPATLLASGAELEPNGRERFGSNPTRALRRCADCLGGASTIA